MTFQIRLWLVVGTCLLHAAVASAAEPIKASPKLPATTPWNLKKLSEPPQLEWVDADGPVRSLLYEGEPYQGKPTRVFAYYATPAPSANGQLREKKLPAVIQYFCHVNTEKNVYLAACSFDYTSCLLLNQILNVKKFLPWQRSDQVIY